VLRIFAIASSIFLLASGSWAVTAASLDGAWEVVSETTVITEPQAKKDVRAAPEWIGMWLFHDGYYSHILTKQDRSDDRWLHPKGPEDMQFEASSGRYQIQGDQLTISKGYAFRPLEHVFPIDYRMTLRGDILTLVESWLPHVENMSAGTTTIILKRKQ
jgi:hypothetical protein